MSPAATTTRSIGPDWLRPGELAKWLRVSPKTVSRWCGQGAIASRRTPGGHWRIDPDALPEAFSWASGNGGGR